MKKIIQIAAVALLMIGSSTFVSAQKYGYANYEFIIQSMPEIKGLNSELETLQAQLQAQLQQKATEIQQIEAQFENIQSQPPAIQENMKTDYQQKLQSFELFQQNAEKDLVNKQEELLQPLLIKVEGAIKAVAKENGFAMIFSKTMMNNPVILFADEKSDITKLVMTKLNIPIPTDTTTATGIK